MIQRKGLQPLINYPKVVKLKNCHQLSTLLFCTSNWKNLAETKSLAQVAMFRQICSYWSLLQKKIVIVLVPGRPNLTEFRIAPLCQDTSKLSRKSFPLRFAKLPEIESTKMLLGKHPSIH